MRHLNQRWPILLMLILLAWLGTSCNRLRKTADAEIPPVAATGIELPSITPAAPAVPPTVVADIKGNWKATVTMPDGSVEIYITISSLADNTLRATMDVPFMDAYDIPLIFSFENNTIIYQIAEYEGFFRGRLADPSTIEGMQTLPEGDPVPLTFKRIE